MDGFALLRSRWLGRARALGLLAVLGLLAGFSGWLMAGVLGASLALGISIVTFLAARRVPVDVVLRLRGARPLGPLVAPGLFRAVEVLARRAGLPRAPRLYVLGSPEPQAVTVGSGADAAIAITPALAAHLSEREVAAVVAHELTHVAHGDTALMAVVDALRRFTGTAATFGFVMLVLGALASLFGPSPVPLSVPILLVLIPTAATFAMLAFSRAREYEADLGAAALLGDPRPLASALLRIEAAMHPRVGWLLPRGVSRLPLALRTHPPTAERIRRLLALQHPGRPSALPS